ncbi:MAG: winged helix-turn-helix domain-containing protein [Methanosarcinaceae archaeon]|nr:winged helix-turn-helix domain-containing protein [Methanosarcinaceae archaeon]
MSNIESRIEIGGINGPEEGEGAKSLRDDAEKLLVIPVNEDSRKITQTLSNETSLKILELLGKKGLSASDIAVELKIPLTTVKYNLDSLVDSELVQVKQIKWSRKGRQVKIYEAMEKLIVLVPSKTFADKISIMSILQQYIGVIAGAFFAAAGIEYLTAYLRARRFLKVLPMDPAGFSTDYTAPETVAAPEAMYMAENASEGGLSPKMAESPGLGADYNVFDKEFIPGNGAMNATFAGDVVDISENDMVAQEAPMEGGVVEGAPVDGASVDGASVDGASVDGASVDGASVDGASVDGALKESGAEYALEDKISMDDALVADSSIDEIPLDEGMPAEEEVSAIPESAPESAPVLAENAVPAEGAELLEGMDSSALDSIPPGTLGAGAGAGSHFFDTLLVHPGVWFLFGCLFVICLLIIREVYYKKKSM